MGEPVADRKRFGGYLRRIREDRKLSLDAVEELTVGYPDPVTKSHLSRIENGSAIPSFGKMFALSQVYGVPIAALSERFEIELLEQVHPPQAVPDTSEELLVQLGRLQLAGDNVAGLMLLIAGRRQLEARGPLEDELRNSLTLCEIEFLIHLDRFELAKVRSEQLLGRADLAGSVHLQALMAFATCCYRLKRYTIAELALDEVDKNLRSRSGTERLAANLVSLRAGVHVALGLHEKAVQTYRSALELHRTAQNRFEACRTQVNLGQALIHAGRLEESAAQLREALEIAEESGYDRFKALALSHLAVVSFRRGDPLATESYALRSNAIARPREYLTVVFRNCYYLRALARQRGDASAVQQNERTLRTYVNRVDSDLPEVVALRAELEGGER